jgi:hypothetical protein
MSARKEMEEPDLGYRFLPTHYPASIGHPKLEINILCAPTEEHFDPKIVQIPVFTSINSPHPHQIIQLRLYHPWVYHSAYHVAPGLITLSDRKGKTVKVYSFGGSMKIDSDENCTTMILQSDAPIIEVTQARSVIRRFVEEVEILLAERRAARAEDLMDFEERLEKIPAALLFAVVLQELEKKYDEAQGGKSIIGRDFLEIIEDEREHMKNEGRWPEDVPSSSDIL